MVLGGRGGSYEWSSGKGGCLMSGPKGEGGSMSGPATGESL